MSRQSRSKFSLAEKLVATLLSFLLVVALIPVGAAAFAGNSGENGGGGAQDGRLTSAPTGGSGDAGDGVGPATSAGTGDSGAGSGDGGSQQGGAQSDGALDGRLTSAPTTSDPTASDPTTSGPGGGSQGGAGDGVVQPVVIIGFAEDVYSDPVDSEIHYLKVVQGTQKTDIDFPDSVQATVEGGELDGYALDVLEWVTARKPAFDVVYDGDVVGSYFFEPVLALGEGLLLGDGVELPLLEVLVQSLEGGENGDGSGDAGLALDSGSEAGMTDFNDAGLGADPAVHIQPLLQGDFGLLAAGEIHIVTVLDASDNTLTTLTVFDGELAQEPEAPAQPWPAGANAFLGWFDTTYLNGLGAAQPDVDRRFDFTQPITKAYTLKAVFTSSYLVQVLDHNNLIVKSYPVVSGQRLSKASVYPPTSYAPPPGESFNGNYQMVDPDPQAGTAFDFNTVITRNYYIKANSQTSWNVFFNTSGSQVADQVVFDGATASQPAAPIRNGYTFARWSTTPDGTTAFNFGTAIHANTIIYAVWTAQAVGFKVVMWVEKPNIASDPSTNPSNYSFAYQADVPASSGYTAGTTLSSAQLTALASGSFLTDAKAVTGAMNFASYSWASAAPLSGNGSTVVNLYFKRNIYTFTIDTRKSASQIGHSGMYNSGGSSTNYLDYNGTQYQNGSNTNRYSYQAKYEQDISSFVPKAPDYKIGATKILAFNYSNSTYENPAVEYSVSLGVATLAENSANNRNVEIAVSTMALGTTAYVDFYIEATYAQKQAIDASGITPPAYNATMTVTNDGSAILPAVSYNGVYYVRNMLLAQAAAWGSDANTAAQWVTQINNIYTSKGTYDMDGYDIVNNTCYVQKDVPTLTVYCLFMYSSKSYTLTLNPTTSSGSGTISGSTTQSIKVGYPVTGIPTPTPTSSGSIFKGWFWDSDFQQPYLGTETMSTANSTLFAKYESTDNTITFLDKQDGNVVGTQGVATAANAVDPGIYSIGQGYPGLGEFVGWYYLRSGTMMPFSWETQIYGDMTLFGNWNTSGFHISYDLDGGTGGATAPSDANSYNLSSLVQVMAPVGGTPTKTDVGGNTLTFVGWTYGGKTYYPGQYFNPSGNSTLVARYISAVLARNLIFNPNGGSGTAATWTVQSGESLLLPGDIDLNFSRTGYRIIGWSATSGTSNTVDSGYATGSSVAVTANKTLFAVWSPKSVAISYHKNDGSANDGYTTGAVLTGTYGAAIASAPTVPTRTGYVLDGWYTAASGGTKWTFGTTALTTANGVVENATTGNETLTLYAHWTLKAYTVNINPNHDGQAAVAQSGKHLGDSVTLTRLTRANWTLVGYATSPSATSATYTQTTMALTESAIMSLFTNDTVNTVTLYAVWRENPKYTVTYNFGTGGQGTVTDTGGNAPSGNSYYTGSAVTVKPSTGFTRANYHFVGWATSGATGAVVYTWNGTTFSPATFNISANTTLYAVWAINASTYTVNVATASTGRGTIATGGSYTASGSSVNYGATVNYSANANAGYRFANWTFSGAGVTLNPNATTVTGSFNMPDNAVTLSANFAANTVTVNTKSGGSDFSSHGTITLGTGASGTISASSGGNTANVVFSGVPNGTYHIFDGTRDTGFTVVVNNNDPTVVVNYVTYTVAQSGGTSGVKTSTGITLTFTSAITGLAAANITLTNGTGTATKGALSGSGTSYTLAVSGVSAGAVAVALSSPNGVFISNSPQNVTLFADTTAPTAQVQYRTSALREFLNNISFGYWFKDTVAVTVTATDGSGDGLATTNPVQYYFATTDQGDGSAITAWQNGSSFTQTPDGKFILYVKVTDLRSNSRIYKDGLVVYTDSSGTASEGKFVKGVTGNVVISGLNFQGNTVKSLRNVTANAVVAASGYSSGTNTVTVTSTYLNTLAVGSYNFELEFNPQGATDAPVTIAGATDTPTKSTFTIKVYDSKTVTSIAQFGGTNGKVRSTGILVTFNSAVTQPPVSTFVVGKTGASTVPGSWTVSDGGDGDDKTWVLVFSGGSWANGATDFTVATASWGNYELSNTGAIALTGAMYAPVELPFTPGIDYINETITGLQSGRTYNYKYGSGASAVSGSFVASGTAQVIDAAWFGKSDFAILAVAAAADPNVNSAYKALAIAARPAAPTLSVSSHQTSGSGVEGAIGGVSTAMEYTLSSPVSWATCTGTSITGLAPGVYNVRVKAVATPGSFRSLPSTVEIHQYDAIGFGPVYEGYVAGPDVAAKNIHDTLIGDPNHGYDITGVAFNSGSTDATAFNLGGTGNGSTIGPKLGLTPGEYDAKLDVTRTSYITGVMTPDVNFTVNGLMAFAATGAVTVNGSTTAASSTLTVNFLHPVKGLVAGDFNISGGAKKTSAAVLTPVTGFGDATNGYTRYTIDIEPASKATYDLEQITVEVTLPTVAAHGLSDIYAAQRADYSITYIQDTSAQVRVPRKVDITDQFVYTMDGFDTSMIQLRLLKTDATPGAYYPIEGLEGLDEIGIVNRGGNADVVRVARVDNSLDSTWGGYTTYNVYLTNVVAGQVGIAFKSYDVQEASVLRYTLVKGATGPIGPRNYFIESGGGGVYQNIPTILSGAATGAQGPILVTATGATAPVAPETALLTNVDLDGSPTVQSVLLDGVPLPSSMWSVSAAPTLNYSYDGGAAVAVNRPLVLTLAAGFTNTNGDKALEVVFSPDSSYLYGLLRVSGITANYAIGLVNGSTAAALGTSPAYDFASLPFGYTPGTPTALGVTVLNTGNQATGALTATLGGSNAGDFELVQGSGAVSAAEITSIANLGSADNAFLVRPKNGLVKGTYTANVVVETAIGNSNTIVPQHFNVSFSVSNTAPGVASGQSTQSGTAAPASYNNGVAAVPYSVNLATAGWFSDADTADTSGMSYSVVSENATGVVGIVGTTLTFTPTVADAGLSRTIVIKANDGTADSTGNVTITVAVAKAVPGVELVAPAVTFGQSLVMTAKVEYSGGAVPTGTVSFYDGTSELAGSVVLTNGVAEFSTSALAGGSHNLEARYNGDAVYKGYADDNTIKGNVTATVNLAGRSITMYNPGNKTYGDAAFTLSLSDLGAGSGAVTYSASPTGILAITGNTATIVGAGPVTITATKASDGNYDAVSDSVSITVAQKELTVAVVVANKPYDGTVTATFSSASPPSLVGLVASDVGSVGLTNGIPVFANVGSADATNNGIAINFTTAFSISGARSAHYRLTQPTGITANITIGFVPVNGTHYSSTPLHGVAGDVKWTNGIFVLTPLSGFQISTASAYPGDFAGTLNLSSAADETTGGQRTFYIRNMATGEISRLGTETYKIDTAAPTATVNYKDKGFTAFLNKITNGLFFEATVKVEILGADTGSSAGANSGVAKVEHFTTTTGFADAAAAEAYGLAISGWVSGTSFDITPAEKGKLHVFARVTDYAGNFAIYYDGLLVYENSIQSGITGSYTKTTMTDVTVDANLKGNSVASIVNATDSNKALSIVEFTSSETGGTGGLGSITIRGNYLDTLDANITYSFIVTYNPMHADARLAELGSDVPLTTTFTIRVYKQTQFTTLLAAGVNSPYTYGDASVNIGATGGNGTGALSFEIVESSVTGVASLSGATATAATLNFLKPGTFKIKQTKAGDGNYEPVTATTGVVEVLYATPQVTLGAGGSGIYGGDVNLTASVIKVGIGAVPTGSVGFYVDGVHVKTATLDAAGQATYAAPLLGAGVHNFEVRYLGNAYYKAYGAGVTATADPSVRGTTSFTIGKAGQTIVLANPGNKTWGDADFGLSLTTLGAGSGPVTYSASPTGILAITGSSAQIVGVGSVTITATKAADNDHNGATDSVTITVGKASIPALWSANAVGSGITYGKTLVNSTLSGWTVNGVGTHAGDVLSGTVTWDAPLTLPDVSAIAGVPAAYAVTFTPTGTDALHYFALQGMANVTVDKATPVLKTPLSGTPFRLMDTLADSVITGGTTSFGYGTQNLDVPGTWDWDNPGHGGTFYVYTGTYSEPASFTPTDTARFYSITAPIDVVVFSPKTVVITPPAVSSLIYGDKISNSGILAVGSLVHAVGDVPPEAVIPGTWTWSNPDDRATAVGLDAYTAELTFTPDWLQADPAHPVPNGGYLPTTVDVQITVGPAEPDLTMVSPGDVVYGKTLDHADLSIYTVEGVFGETITGKLEWKYPDIVPSDVIGEVGIYTAVAVFTPLDSFAPLYVVKEFDIDVLVVADTEALDELSEDIVTPLIPALHDEDYPELAIDELADALDNANTVRSTVGVTQAAVNEAYAELFAVYEAMEHDHPVLEHSAHFLPMTDTSDGFYVRIKGYFGSVLPVLGVTLDDVELVHTPTAETGVHDLAKGGVHVGTLSEGSARVTLTPEFLATLENGVYTIKVNFDDGFRTGEGITTFEIRRPIVDDGSGFPGTGDDMTLWLLMILLVTVGMTALTWWGSVRGGRRLRGSQSRRRA